MHAKRRYVFFVGEVAQLPPLSVRECCRNPLDTVSNYSSYSALCSRCYVRLVVS